MPTTLDEVFVEELCRMYDGEQQITKALPKMAEAASSESLKAAFQEHLDETEQQLERLDKVFDQIDAEREKVTCEPIQGLVSEAETMIANIDTPEVLDAVLIIGAQKVEHYEMAAYGSLRELANCLGYTDSVSLLEETLEEEKAADQKLNTLAVDEINDKAAEASEEAE